MDYYTMSYLLSFIKQESVDATQNIINPTDTENYEPLLTYWRMRDRIPYVFIDASKKYTNEELDIPYIFVVGNIPDDFFHNCLNIKQVVIHNKEPFGSIGERAFKNCYELRKIHISPNINSIGEECFKHCEILTSIKLPNIISELNTSLFEGCVKLSKLQLSDRTYKVHKFAFRDCRCLKQITIYCIKYRTTHHMLKDLYRTLLRDNFHTFLRDDFQ